MDERSLRWEQRFEWPLVTDAVDPQVRSADAPWAMSRENAELVRRIYDGRSRGDFSVGRDLLTHDFEWSQHAEAVEAGPRAGAAIATALRNIFEVYENFRVVPDRYVSIGERVLVITHNRATARRSGMKVDQRFAYLWTVRGDKLARVEVYADERAALEAVGLRGQGMPQENVEIARRAYEAFNGGDLEGMVADRCCATAATPWLRLFDFRRSSGRPEARGA